MELMNYVVENALILIPVLNVIGTLIKNTPKIKSGYIPLILLVLGIGGAIGLMGWSMQSVVQGVLVAGASVYGHQCVKEGKALISPK